MLIIQQWCSSGMQWDTTSNNRPKSVATLDINRLKYALIMCGISRLNACLTTSSHDHSYHSKHPVCLRRSDSERGIRSSVTVPLYSDLGLRCLDSDKAPHPCLES